MDCPVSRNIRHRAAPRCVEFVSLLAMIAYVFVRTGCAQQPQPVPRSFQMSVTVLVVDDSKLARINAGKALNQLQPEWRRVEAASAADALEVVGREPVDIALIDFNM